MIMKKIIILIIIFIIFYVFLFFISKNFDKNYFLGCGWKVYLKESENTIKIIKVGVLKEGDEIFVKNVKIYPETNGILSFDLIKDLTKINLETPFIDLIKIVSKKSGSILIKVQFEEKKYDFINYLFGLPIRIDEIKIKVPLNILEISIE